MDDNVTNLVGKTIIDRHLIQAVVTGESVWSWHTLLGMAHAYCLIFDAPQYLDPPKEPNDNYYREIREYIREKIAEDLQ